jgi:hypothetical protein
VAAHTRVHALYPQLAIVVNDEMRALPEELAAPGLALRKESLALLMAILQRGIALGRFSIANPVVVAAAIGAMGMRVPYWYAPTLGIAVDELAATQADLALRMVGARA